MCILTGRQGLLEPQGSLWWGMVVGEKHVLQLEKAHLQMWCPFASININI